MNIRNYTRQAPATSAIMLICVVVFLIAAVQSRSLGDLVWGSPLGIHTVLWGPFVTSEPLGALRAITAMFLHLDIGHLTLNMLFLLFIGREIERYLGTPLYAATYLAGGLGGSAAILLMDPNTPTAGASGALYALMAVLIAVASRRSADLRAPLVLLVMNVLYTLISPGVSLWGHLGGLIAGALMAWPVTSRSKLVRWLAVLVVGGVSAAFVVTF
nr:rhomboid family intramembrane serine protease [Corynebacterium lubricantis]